MPVTLRDISKSGGYNPPPGPLSRFPDLKNKIQAAMDFKKQSKAANAQEKYIFLHVFIIFGEPRKIQKRRKNARTIFVFCMFSMGSISFKFFELFVHGQFSVDSEPSSCRHVLRLRQEFGSESTLKCPK